MQKILSKYKVKFRDYKAASQDEREIADWIVTDLTFGYYDPADVKSAKFSRQMSGKSGLMNLVLLSARGSDHAQLFAFTRESSDNVVVNANGVAASEELYVVDKPLINDWIVLVTRLDGKWVTYHWEAGQYVTTDPSATQKVELPQHVHDEHDPERASPPAIGTRIHFARQLKDATELEVKAWDSLNAGPANWEGFVSRRILGKHGDPSDLGHYDVLFKVRKSPQEPYNLAIAIADRIGGFSAGFMGIGLWEVISVYALHLQPGDDYRSLRSATPTGDVVLYWGEGGYSTPS